MSVITRLQRALQAYRSAPDLKALSRTIDEMKKADIPISQQIEEKMAKAPETASSLKIRQTDKDMAFASAIQGLRLFANNARDKNHIPGRYSPDRDVYLADMWKEEPILAGAIYSMTAKMMSMKWTITGRRNKAIQMAKILSRAAFSYNGLDWGGFISSVATDFYTTNRGAFIETAKTGDPTYGELADIGHIDALACTLTGNSVYPVQYMSEETGQNLRFVPGQYIHFASLPSPRERDLGVGMCAVDRSLRAALLLLSLHDYDTEKLNNLPPEGLAAISGLTMQEFQDSLTLWKAARQQDNSLTYPQVLWLLGSQPGSEVKVAFSSFSQLPESFDRKTVVEQYINILALGFGVDTREFWPISTGGLGSAGQSDIQHMKARGKGPGEFITTTERNINGEMPEGVDFGFQVQDPQESAAEAAVAKAWVDAFFPLFNLPPEETAAEKKANAEAAAGNVATKANPNPVNSTGDKTGAADILGTDTGRQMTYGGGQPNTPKSANQAITKDQLLRLLADKGVIPDYFLDDTRTVIESSDVHNRLKNFDSEGHPDDVTQIVWERGVLKEVRAPAIILYSHREVSYDEDKIDFVEGNFREVAQPLLPAKTKEKKEDPEPERFVSLEEALDFLVRKENKILAERRNIHGEPIPDREVSRGSGVTAKTIHEELMRWRKHPILSKYALTPEEEKKLLETLNVAARNR